MRISGTAPQKGHGSRSGFASSASLIASGSDAQSSAASASVMSKLPVDVLFPASTWTNPGYLPVYSAFTLSPRIWP